ncbi:hypothetical protein PUN28_014676 [Cardiocondyla obscurior]|uniref:Cytochrome P450 n=1 Tax=Cardiocondyla obscurior TaxID=286306 RepID=A0AAW2EUU0_9HYME
MVLIFTVLLIILVVIAVLKPLSKVHDILTYWNNKKVPYVPSLTSISVNWKTFLGYITFTDLCEYLYQYCPNAKYVCAMIFNTPTIIIGDHRLIQDVCVKDFEYFEDHSFLVDENIEPVVGKSLFSLRGDRWREMRNTLSPVFTTSKMKFMFELINKCSQNYVNYLVEHPELCQTVQTKEIFQRFSNDVIAITNYGVSVNSMKNPDNELYAKGSKASKLSFGFLASIKFVFLYLCPWLAKLMGVAFFPLTTTNFFKRFVTEIIEERKERNIIRQDLIHSLMQTQEKNDRVHKIGMDDIVSQAFNFFFASIDLTSKLMCFVAHELAVHQDIQDRLREEVQRHFTESDEISYKSLMKMNYMDMVVTEILRKYPPLPFIDRLCIKKYELPPAQPGCENIIVEPGDSIIFPVYSLHHDPKYFAEPEKFDPDRFNEKNKGNILQYTYLPFGVGPRKCIALRFVLMKTKVLIAHLLQRFTLKTVDKTLEPIAFSKKEFILSSANGFWISLEKREA